MGIIGFGFVVYMVVVYCVCVEFYFVMFEGWFVNGIVVGG